MTDVSRRDFVRIGATSVVAGQLVLDPIATSAASLTAQDVVERIRTAAGVEWKADTVDTFKAGDPSTVVTGVATTSLATIDVMRRAVKAGANLIVTSGPTFYSRADSPAPPAGRGRGAPTPPPADPVFAAKREFIRANRLVVWRFSEHWRLVTPNPFAQGLVEALGWGRRVIGDPSRVTVPSIAVQALVRDMRQKLAVRGGMRVVGQPQTRVRTIGVLPGTVPIQTTLAVLPQVDAIVAGEIREWESSEYVRDVVHAGGNKALILVGRSLSEDTGMQRCARWLQPLLSGTPVRWIPAGDPYWSPSA
jgi:putative NIF3 family GTP cyclohydrolase 1 type 2